MTIHHLLLLLVLLLPTTAATPPPPFTGAQTPPYFYYLIPPPPPSTRALTPPYYYYYLIPPPPPAGQGLSTATTTILTVVLLAFLLAGFTALYMCRSRCVRNDGTTPRSAAGAGRPGRALSRRGSGLDPEVIKSFQVLNYSDIKHLRIGDGALTCAVCVSEFRDDERLRLLPKCDHAFHPECIDPWLASHPTCPICRANPSQETASTRSVDECDSGLELGRVQGQNEVSTYTLRLQPPLPPLD